MKLSTLLARWTTAGLLGLGSMGAAQSAVLTTFTFNGDCVDCAPGFFQNQLQVTTAQDTVPVTATLVLSDWAANSPITLANFVSFTYNGSSLVDAFTVVPGAPIDQVSISAASGPVQYFATSVSGQVGPSTSTDFLNLAFIGGAFNLLAGGEWNLCANHANPIVIGENTFLVVCSTVISDPDLDFRLANDFGVNGRFLALPPPNGVPVMGTLWLLGAAIGALGLMRRRQFA